MESLLATEGYATFTVGLLGILFGAIWLTSNYLAGLVWGLAVIVLIFVGLFGIAIELFWLTIVGVLILIMAGMAVRGMA